LGRCRPNTFCALLGNPHWHAQGHRWRRRLKGYLTEEKCGPKSYTQTKYLYNETLKGTNRVSPAQAAPAFLEQGTGLLAPATAWYLLPAVAERVEYR
jgi:hypothetical protein